jgi:hypothetical protein
MPNPWLNEHKSKAAMNYFLILTLITTKPGEVDKILTLYQLKSPYLDSKAKFKSPGFFLKVTNFLQIICILW